MWCLLPLQSEGFRWKSNSSSYWLKKVTLVGYCGLICKTKMFFWKRTKKVLTSEHSWIHISFTRKQTKKKKNYDSWSYWKKSHYILFHDVFYLHPILSYHLILSCLCFLSHGLDFFHTWNTFFRYMNWYIYTLICVMNALQILYSFQIFIILIMSMYFCVCMYVIWIHIFLDARRAYQSFWSWSYQWLCSMWCVCTHPARGVSTVNQWTISLAPILISQI